MKKSSLYPNQIDGLKVSGRNQHGQQVSHWQNASFAPAGGVLSCTSELCQFILKQFDTSDQAINLNKKETYTRDEKISLGLGWAILKKESNVRYHFHPGGTIGYRSCLAMDETHHTGVVVLTNSSCFHKKAMMVNDLCFALLHKLNHFKPVALKTSNQEFNAKTLNHYEN